MSVRIKSEPIEEVCFEDTDGPVPITTETEALRTGIYDNEDDEVVREIDVYLSPALESQLYLVQFPLQHQEMSLPLDARIKPQHGILELDQAVPRIGQRDVPAELDLDQRTYVSGSKTPVSTHLAVGKIEKNSINNNITSLHIVPLSRIAQMRPSFSHIDELDEDSGDTAKSDGGGESNVKLEKKPVLFEKKEPERATIARKKSYAFKKASEEAEKWTTLTVYGPNTPVSKEIQHEVICPNQQVQLVNAEQQQKEKSGTNNVSASYVHSLNYSPDSAAMATDAYSTFDSEGDTMDMTKLCSKLYTLLQRGWPVPYSVIRSHFSNDLTDSDLLTALASCAVLVRGNFVLQSHLAPLPKLSGKDIISARTFILFLLQVYGFVERYRLQYVYRDHDIITTDIIHMLLQQVAKKCKNGWTLRVTENLQFYQDFPDQAQLHLKYWETYAVCFEEQMEDYNLATLDMLSQT